ncbi:MAG TPA: hypothetical protein VK464_03150 [Symbiobacteriaceae bacterium]|jgi:hypothetical protein|nr:hypothetical protein [Symbiobacteriaceae bacterium]
MPTILAANRSNVLVNGKTLEGLQEISYQLVRPRADIAAIGTDERIGVVFGQTNVVGTLRVRSASQELDDLLAGKGAFQIMASLRPNGSDEALTVTLDECYIEGKSFGLAAGGVAEVIYQFSATRVK